MSWKPQLVLGSVCSCGWAAQQGWGRAPQPPPAGGGVGARRSIPFQKLKMPTTADLQATRGDFSWTFPSKECDHAITPPSRASVTPSVKWDGASLRFRVSCTGPGRITFNTKASPFVPRCFPGVSLITPAGRMARCELAKGAARVNRAWAGVEPPLSTTSIRPAPSQPELDRLAASTPQHSPGREGRQALG